jgi:hypothetical protein
LVEVVEVPRTDDRFDVWSRFLVSVALSGRGALLLDISRCDFDE